MILFADDTNILYSHENIQSQIDIINFLSKRDFLVFSTRYRTDKWVHERALCIHLWYKSFVFHDLLIGFVG